MGALDCIGGTPHRGIIPWLRSYKWSDQCYRKIQRLRRDFVCSDWVVGSLAISTFILTLLVVVLAAVVRIRRLRKQNASHLVTSPTTTSPSPQPDPSQSQFVDLPETSND